MKTESRRAFLLSLLGGFALGCGGATQVRGRRHGSRYLVPLSEVATARAAGEPVMVLVPEPPQAIVLVWTPEGTVRALEARCTHLGCILRASQGFLHCPCHGSTFDLLGNAIHGPARRPLSIYATSVREEVIEIITE